MIPRTLLALSLLVLVPSPGQIQVPPCAYTPSSYTPPPLPPCSGLYNLNCVRACGITYSANMAASANTHCQDQQNCAFDTFDCMADGGTVAECQAALSVCLVDSDENRADRDAAIEQAYTACALGCCHAQ